MTFMKIDGLWSYLKTSRHWSLFWISRVIEAFICVYIWF